MNSLTVNSEFIPQTKSFNFLVGAHPDPSIVCSRNKLKEKAEYINRHGPIPLHYLLVASKSHALP
jgi:hypothetical protein